MTMQQTEGLQSEQFTVGDTVFNIGKLSALKQFEVFEEIRFHLAHETDALSFMSEATDLAMAGTDVNDMASGFNIMDVVMKLKPDFVTYVANELFKTVTFRNANMSQAKLMTPEMEDMAFQNINFVYRYELIARCLAVNFSDSFQLIVSRLTHFGGDKTLTPSSQGASPRSLEG